MGYLGDPRPGVGVITGQEQSVIPDIEWCSVPADRFTMGEDDDKHELEIAGFFISRYPITNAQYQPFIDAGGYDEARWWTPEGWAWRQGENSDLSKITDKSLRDILERNIAQRKVNERQQPWFWGDERMSAPTRPVVGMNWHEALAYCRWLDHTLRNSPGPWHGQVSTGYRVTLPSEAQWEKAARGPAAYAWPWGDEWREDHANTEETGLKESTPVGLFVRARSPYGCHDMAGNVWEWTSTRWGSDFDKANFDYPYNARDGREELDGGDLRVLRGGSWLLDPRLARCAYRSSSPPAYARDDIGFRLVFSLLNSEF